MSRPSPRATTRSPRQAVGYEFPPRSNEGDTLHPTAAGEAAFIDDKSRFLGQRLCRIAHIGRALQKAKDPCKVESLLESANTIKRYQYTAIDDATRHTQANAIAFIDYVTAKFPFGIREVRADNGHEFKAKFHWQQTPQQLRVINFAQTALVGVPTLSITDRKSRLEIKPCRSGQFPSLFFCG
jgi:hypothetical protein